jgi:molybdopterin/thiamine biosynthesis adenylyltransferase
MNERYSRNEAMFGADGQAKIGNSRVAIVGVGGLGSHVAQQLAYLGVNHYALIDFDIVTDSSLNRLIGATAADVEARAKKVTVAERVIMAVNPPADVTPVDGSVADADTARHLAAADIVFGCVDHDVHRLEIMELAARHARPYFDLATDVHLEAAGLTWGGRVAFCDGTRCLACLPEILDQRAIALARMDPQQRDADRRIYGVDRNALDEIGPSVVSLNGVVASLAVTEFMVWVTGLRQPAAHLVYDATKGGVRLNTDEPSTGCYYCQGIWGTASRRAGD